MCNLRIFCVWLAFISFAGLSVYELVAKSQALFGDPLPGWNETRLIERSIPYASRTGLVPLDRLLHEGQEAVAYYSFFLR